MDAKGWFLVARSLWGNIRRKCTLFGSRGTEHTVGRHRISVHTISQFRKVGSLEGQTFFFVL